MPLPIIAAALGSLTAKIGLDAGGFVGGLGKAASKAKEFGGTVSKAIGAAKENVLPLWAGLQLVHQAFNLVLGPSEVLEDIFGAISDIWGELVDSILMAFQPVWMPLIQTFQELVTTVLPQVIPFFQQIAKIFADWLVPMLKEYRPELEIIVKAFAMLVGMGLVAFFGAFLVVLQAVLLVVRYLREQWDAFVNGINNFKGAIGGAGGAVGNFFGGIGGWFNQNMPHFQGGGVMPHTGPAWLEAGETVSRPGEAGGAVHVHIGSFFGTRENIEELARVLGDVLDRRRNAAVNTLR